LTFFNFYEEFVLELGVIIFIPEHSHFPAFLIKMEWVISNWISGDFGKKVSGKGIIYPSVPCFQSTNHQSLNIDENELAT